MLKDLIGYGLYYYNNDTNSATIDRASKSNVELFMIDDHDHYDDDDDDDDNHKDCNPTTAFFYNNGNDDQTIGIFQRALRLPKHDNNSTNTNTTTNDNDNDDHCLWRPETTCAAILFNLGLSHHLRGVASCSSSSSSLSSSSSSNSSSSLSLSFPFSMSDGDDDNDYDDWVEEEEDSQNNSNDDEFLEKALAFYQLSEKVLLKGRQLACGPWIHMAIANNVASLLDVLGDDHDNHDNLSPMYSSSLSSSASQSYLEHLLSMQMFLMEWFGYNHHHHNHNHNNHNNDYYNHYRYNHNNKNNDRDQKRQLLLSGFQQNTSKIILKQSITAPGA